jgi:branched-subunit amino acid transport protein
MPDQPDAPRAAADLGARARENLSFIRNTMERATAFTGVPGWGGVWMGATALVAAGIAREASSTRGWLGVWLAEGVLAFLIGAWSLGRKSRRLQGSVLARPARQFLLSFAPPVLVGALLTAVLFGAGHAELLPGVWLLLYGAGVVTGGAFSVRAVPLMGLLLMGVGAVALFWPAWGNLAMAAGFGLVQVGFGWYIARRHGG